MGCAQSEEFLAKHPRDPLGDLAAFPWETPNTSTWLDMKKTGADAFQVQTLEEEVLFEVTSKRAKGGSRTVVQTTGKKVVAVCLLGAEGGGVQLYGPQPRFEGQAASSETQDGLPLHRWAKMEADGDSCSICMVSGDGAFEAPGSYAAWHVATFDGCPAIMASKDGRGCGIVEYRNGVYELNVAAGIDIALVVCLAAVKAKTMTAWSPDKVSGVEGAAEEKPADEAEERKAAEEKPADEAEERKASAERPTEEKDAEHAKRRAEREQRKEKHGDRAERDERKAKHGAKSAERGEKGGEERGASEKGGKERGKESDAKRRERRAKSAERGEKGGEQGGDGAPQDGDKCHEKRAKSAARGKKGGEQGGDGAPQDGDKRRERRAKSAERGEKGGEARDKSANGKVKERAARAGTKAKDQE